MQLTGGRVEIDDHDRALGRRAHVNDLPSVFHRPLLRHVQMSAKVQPRRDELAGIEKTSLATMAAGGCEVSETDRTPVSELNVERAGGRDPGGAFGNIGIGDVKRLGVRFGPDTTDRRHS